MKKASLLFLAFTLGIPLSAKEAPRKIERTISFSSGYLKFANSNKALSGFAQEMRQGVDCLFDHVAEGDWGTRNREWLVLLNMIPSYYTWTVLGFMYHELGHFARSKAEGGNPFFYDERKRDEPDPQKARDEGYTNPFSYTLQRMVYPIPKGVTYTGVHLNKNVIIYRGLSSAEKDILDTLIDTMGSQDAYSFLVGAADGFAQGATPAQVETARKVLRNVKELDFISSAAGVNNSMRYAGDMSDGVQRGNGHIASFMDYFMAKVDTLIYPVDESRSGNDMTAIRDNYKDRGIKIVPRDYKIGSAVAAFCSASTWAYIWGYMDFFETGNTVVPKPELYGVRLPDIESYIMFQGLTYKVKTGYNVDDTFSIPVAVEFFSKGPGKGAEWTLGAEKSFEDFYDMTLMGSITFGRALGWEFAVRQPIADQFFVEASVGHMRYKGFHGQRNISSLKKSDKETSFLIRAGLRY